MNEYLCIYINKGYIFINSLVKKENKKVKKRKMLLTS